MVKTKKKATLSDLYDRVCRKSDMKTVKINAAETKRVIACFFDCLEDYSAAEAFDLVSKGLARAKSRRR